MPTLNTSPSLARAPHTLTGTTAHPAPGSNAALNLQHKSHSPLIAKACAAINKSFIQGGHTMTTTKRTHTPAIPALIAPDLMGTPPALFWAAETLNCDSKLMAIDALKEVAYKAKRQCSTTNIALMGADGNQRYLRDTAALFAQEKGGLLFCWHGSQAFKACEVAK